MKPHIFLARWWTRNLFSISRARASSRLRVLRPPPTIKISMIVQNDVKIPWRAPAYWLTSHPINHSPRDSLYEARIIDAAETAIDTPLSTATLRSFLLPFPFVLHLVPPLPLLSLSLLFPASCLFPFSSYFIPHPLLLSLGSPPDSPIMTRCWPRKLHQYLRNELRANPFVSRTPGIRASANGIWIIEYPPYPARIYEPREYIVLLEHG